MIIEASSTVADEPNDDGMMMNDDENE